MLAKITSSVKSFAFEYRRDIFIALCIILVAIISFGLGRLSVAWNSKTPIRFETIQ